MPFFLVPRIFARRESAFSALFLRYFRAVANYYMWYVEMYLYTTYCIFMQFLLFYFYVKNNPRRPVPPEDGRRANYIRRRIRQKSNTGLLSEREKNENMENLNPQNNNTEGQLPPPPTAGAAPGLPPAGLPGKRGRGRPKGSTNKAKRAGLALPPGWTPQPAPAAPGEPGSGPAGLGEPPLDQQPNGDSPASLWTEENARPFAELPFLAGAVITSFDGFLLDDKEAIGISKPLASVLNRYFPSGSEYADVSCLCATMLVIYGMKHKAYQEWLKTREAAK